MQGPQDHEENLRLGAKSQFSMEKVLSLVRLNGTSVALTGKEAPGLGPSGADNGSGLFVISAFFQSGVGVKSGRL